METKIKVTRSCFVLLLILFGVTLTSCAINDNSEYIYTDFYSSYLETFLSFERHNNEIERWKHFESRHQIHEVYEAWYGFSSQHNRDFFRNQKKLAMMKWNALGGLSSISGLRLIIYHSGIDVLLAVLDVHA